MSTATVRVPGTAPQRAVTSCQESEIVSRLRKAHGQLAGATAMYEDGRYCMDVLDQLAAVTAAVDAVAVLILTDHLNACVRAAIDSGNPDENVPEMVTAVRRYVRRR